MAEPPEKRNLEIVRRLWDALYRKDWEGVAACIAPEGHYEDVPAPDPGATGPENVVRRLRIGLDPVVRFEHDIHRVVGQGSTVKIAGLVATPWSPSATTSSPSTRSRSAGSSSGGTTGTCPP